jgi:pyrroloquinoline quinone (PQQ) biosynthesis protein C
MPAKKAISTKRNPELLRAIQNRQRDHFHELLERLVGAEPTPAQIKRWARENPASYYKSVKTMSGLAGYEDGSDVTNNFLVQVCNMSDMALEIELGKLMPLMREYLEKDITPGS